MKAFLGMGLLGSNFVKAMLQKGEAVQIWNRTASKAKALETFGAKAFDDVSEAVKDADVIHLTLKDDAAVDEVLKNASGGLKAGAAIIDHTTTSAKGAIERTNAWKAKGFTYLHAPVFMGPKNALEGSGVMLVSGNQDIIKKFQPELSAMTGTLLNLGDIEGKAAGIKLTGNLFLLSLTAGLADALALAKAHDITADEIQNLFSVWNPGAGAPARLKKITSGTFSQPSWELNMARKDAGLMMNAADEAGSRLITTPAIAAVMDEWIAKGHGNDDWSVIAKNNI
ncbi:NAD(P)-dependent oxidoreductase [Parafilimonas terrae]|uniref:3-hydroxyisobutyrate dehydrogenase n=1 Tax=Parafilimonas terrae TaxID=1465490 RepID=A0A1I5WBJ8_9BACT|nr:NAD(P)-binding domain-containing protein [Parafilimonas terrae]SFQ17134.1 3-hydroxyisobutyrate dehydrogenase [Parafilimonas terrae]